jgi:hypothetical protein
MVCPGSGTACEMMKSIPFADAAADDDEDDEDFLN